LVQSSLMPASCSPCNHKNPRSELYKKKRSTPEWGSRRHAILLCCLCLLDDCC
jgi:hypothetical protein